ITGLGEVCMGARVASYGPRSLGAAERAIPKITRAMKSNARVIAVGKRIDKVDVLVEKFGGTRRGWRKMEVVDPASGAKIHYYEHHGIGVQGAKWDGFPDPF